MADREPAPRRFAGRRALVTGASRGIGAAVAQRLAAEGADVAILARTLDAGDSHLSGSLSSTVDRIEAHGAKAVPLVVDLSDPDGRAGVLARAADGLGGPVEILVNNAAAAMYARLAEMPIKRRRILFELNVHAPLDLAQQAIPSMSQAGEGWIVNVSSGTARNWDGPPFVLGALGSTTTAYGASKAALNRITNGLAAELQDRGIRVSSVEPRAAVMSEGTEALVGSKLDPSQLEPLEAMVEATVALCCCATESTGLQAVSLDLIDDWDLEVRNLDGTVRP